MLTDDETTFHIRSIVEAGDNPAKEVQALKSFEILRHLHDSWMAQARINEEMPHSVYRIHRLLTFIDGQQISYTEDPWITLSLIIANYENNSTNMRDHMPNVWGITLVKDWQGELGTEPAWLNEMDQVLMKHVYESALVEFEYSSDAIATFRNLTPAQRAQEIGEQLYFLF